LPAPEPELDASYDPALVNADCDLAALEADLLRPDAPRAVSFLLAGPPGAGKSAWIWHLAGRMGLPVPQKRASDLLDAFVGDTEHKIAGAFAEARDTGAFLVFDEADSLLLERTLTEPLAAGEAGFDAALGQHVVAFVAEHPASVLCRFQRFMHLGRSPWRAAPAARRRPKR
jgi:transitional endoplasmic reticulum ATPase